MKQLAVCILCVIAPLWIWSKYFRTIPDMKTPALQQSVVIEKRDDFSGDYIVVAKKIYGARHSSRHLRSTSTSNHHEFSDISTVDLLLLKAPYAQSTYLKGLDYSQKNRCIYADMSYLNSVSPELKEHTFNINVIADNAFVAKTLRKLKKGQIIRLAGYTVGVESVKNRHGYYQPLHRNPQCQKVLIESLVILG